MKAKIQQYRKDGKNLFSSTEKIMVALLCPDLYLELMPEKYKNNPFGAFFIELDFQQKQMFFVLRRTGEIREANER